MTIPDFNKYGILGCLNFVTKTKPATTTYGRHIDTTTENRDTKALREFIHTNLANLFNDRLTELTSNVIDEKLKLMSYASSRVAIHRLVPQPDISAKYTTINEATKLVMEETTNVLLPTVTTKQLLSELVVRSKHVLTNNKVFKSILCHVKK